jgi:hypothetical protein
VASLIGLLNGALTWGFDRVCLLLRPLGVWGVLVVFALLVGALAVRVWARCGDREGVRRSREKLLASLLAIRLFQHDLRIFLGLQGSMLRAALVYMGQGVKPALVLAVPLLLCLIQLEGRCGLRPLRVGETALVRVQVDKAQGLRNSGKVGLRSGGGVAVETSGVRLPDRGEVVWRVRGLEAGRHRLTIDIADRKVEKEVWVGEMDGLISGMRTGEGWLDLLLHPGELPIPAGSGIVSIAVDYPRKELGIWRWKSGWLVPFFALSMVAGLAFKRVWKVEM